LRAAAKVFLEKFKVLGYTWVVYLLGEGSKLGYTWVVYLLGEGSKKRPVAQAPPVVVKKRPASKGQNVRLVLKARRAC